MFRKFMKKLFYQKLLIWNSLKMDSANGVTLYVSLCSCKTLQATAQNRIELTMFLPTPKWTMASSSAKICLGAALKLGLLKTVSKAFFSHNCRSGKVSWPENWGLLPRVVSNMPHHTLQTGQDHQSDEKSLLCCCYIQFFVDKFNTKYVI